MAFCCSCCRLCSDALRWVDYSQQLSTHTATCLLPPHRDGRENKAKVRHFIGEEKDRSTSEGNREGEQTSDATTTTHHCPQADRCPFQSLSNNYLENCNPLHCRGFIYLFLFYLLLSMTSYGLDHPFGQFASPAYRARERPNDGQSQQPKHQWVVNTLLGTNPSHSTIGPTMKKGASIPLPKRMRHKLIIYNTKDKKRSV